MEVTYVLPHVGKEDFDTTVELIAVKNIWGASQWLVKLRQRSEEISIDLDLNHCDGTTSIERLRKTTKPKDKPHEVWEWYKNDAAIVMPEEMKKAFKLAEFLIQTTIATKEKCFPFVKFDAE